MEVPPSFYFRSERGAIACQVFGNGDRTVIWTGPPWVSITTRWDRPATVRLMEFLASVGRVVLFDYRGFGLSEHLSLDRIGSMDELVFDLDVVVRELSQGPAVVVGTGASARVAITYAAAAPPPLERLILLNVSNVDRVVSAIPSEDIESLHERWGSGTVLAPAISEGARDFALAARAEQMSATPDVAAAYVHAMGTHDVRHLLPHIAVPTLVVHTGDVGMVTPEITQEVATAIPDAAFIVRPSELFNWGDWDADLKRFITGDPTATIGRRDLAAVMFSDVVDSTQHAAELGDSAWRETLAMLDALVAAEVGRANGRIVKQTGDGHLLEFARPSDALACAERLSARSPQVGVTQRLGIHFGEIERRPDGDIGGLAVHLAARVAAQAGPGEILVTHTVVDVTIGDGRTYDDRGTPTLKGIPGTWRVLALDPAEAPTRPSAPPTRPRSARD